MEDEVEVVWPEFPVPLIVLEIPVPTMDFEIEENFEPIDDEDEIFDLLKAEVDDLRLVKR